jgi:hypothetical protein
MKYSLNQHYKFSNYLVVFFVYFFRFIIILGIEIANILVIVNKNTIQDVICNFVALTAITQFDDFFYENITDDEFKGYLVTKKDEIRRCFRIETTTSWQSDSKDEFKDYVDYRANLKDNEGENPIKIKVCRCGDSFWRGFFFVVYKFLRVVYVSTWYYFAPFLAIILSYAKPVYKLYQLSLVAVDGGITGQ